LKGYDEERYEIANNFAKQTYEESEVMVLLNKLVITEKKREEVLKEKHRYYNY
jgi:hypothetical protein